MGTSEVETISGNSTTNRYHSIDAGTNNIHDTISGAESDQMGTIVKAQEEAQISSSAVTAGQPDGITGSSVAELSTKSAFSNVQRIVLSGISTAEFFHGPGNSNSGANIPSDQSKGAADEPKKDTSEQKVSKKKTYLIKLRYVIQEEDEEGKVLKVTKFDEPPNDEDETEVPIMEKMIVKTKANVNGVELYEQTYLNILSPLLVNAIRSVVTYTSENLDGNRIQLSAPYKLLYNHWSELEDYKSNHPVTHDEAYIAECNAHIDFLLRFLEESDGGGIRIEQARWNRDRPTATFKNLWLLLKPGEMVFVRKDDEPSPYVVEWVGGGVIKGKATAYKVEVWNIDYDGQYFGRSLFNVEIKPFDGEVEISRLKIYPEAYHPNLESERERLIARGKKFFKAVKDYSFMEYTGTTVQGPKRKYVRERIVFDYTFQPWLESQLKNKHEPDFSGYFSDSMGASNCFCDACLKAEEAKTCNTMGRYYGWDQMDPTETSFSDQQYLLCSRIVYGYVLKERQWRILDVAGVSVPTFNPGIMDSLVMDENKKDVIKAICHEFTRSETNFTADFVPGKGQGRIFLLHGKPGVGKTLTAECVAENTRRPLLSITAGDIGTTGDRVEANLSRYFKWAEDWKAILLMDEADIYLEERSKRELERNSVVSVFLRALEYYSGILFITTNRVGTFDEAFQSRIHISIHYKGFDEKQRRQVWENNFDKLYKERNGKVSYDYSVREFVLRDKYVQDLDWNGREIRNCFQTAVTLAEYEANREGRDTVQLKKSHLERVMDMSKAFENYLIDARGADDSSRARDYRIRADDYDDDRNRDKYEEEDRRRELSSRRRRRD